MPFTPLPPSNTKRYFLHHTVAGEGHVALCRVSSGVNDATAISTLQTFCNAVKPYFCDNVVFDGLEVSAVGSDVRLPVSGWTNIVGTSGLTCANEARANQLTFPGRGTSGRKARVGFFGMAITPNGSFRLPSTNAVPIAMYAALTATTGFWLAIDATQVNWHNYANYGYNDHWVGELR